VSRGVCRAMMGADTRDDLLDRAADVGADVGGARGFDFRDEVRSGEEGWVLGPSVCNAASNGKHRADQVARERACEWRARSKQPAATCPLLALTSRGRGRTRTPSRLALGRSLGTRARPARSVDRLDRDPCGQ
jgi:hypothetical protein